MSEIETSNNDTDLKDSNNVTLKDEIETELEKSTENEILASNNSANIITVNKTSNSINYKVQILAAHKITSKKHLYNQFKFSDNYDLENHEGWIKYTTGFYSQYKGARDKRNSLAMHEFPGPFVTAYNHGERITVQEALIISDQKWIQ